MTKTTYIVEDGQFYRQVVLKSGDIRIYQICNFTAWITDEKFDDKGQRYFKLEGKREDGSPLESFWLRIYPSDRYKKGLVSQLLGAWGSRAIVAARAGSVSHLKAAIQWYSLQKGSANAEVRPRIEIW